MSVTPSEQTTADSGTSVTAPLHIQFDGSLRQAGEHEEASAAIGYRITDTAGDTIAEESYRLAYWRSNTHIEYDALIAALKHAAALDYSGHVIIHGDAESVIRVVDEAQSPTANDNITQRYAEKTRVLLEQFESYHLSSVPRTHNEKADVLAESGHTDDPIPL